MDKNDIIRFRQSLESMRDDLLAATEETRESMRPVALDQSTTGRLTRMDAMQAQEMALETARRRAEHVAKIELALARIEQDDYGECIDCGEQIDIRRLDHNPSAERCVGCLEKRETV